MTLLSLSSLISTPSQYVLSAVDVASLVGDSSILIVYHIYPSQCVLSAVAVASLADDSPVIFVSQYTPALSDFLTLSNPFQHILSFSSLHYLISALSRLYLVSPLPCLSSALPSLCLVLPRPYLSSALISPLPLSLLYLTSPYLISTFSHNYLVCVLCLVCLQTNRRSFGPHIIFIATSTSRRAITSSYAFGTIQGRSCCFWYTADR